MDTTLQIALVFIGACLFVGYLYVRDFMRGMNKVHHSREDEGT